MKRAIPRNHVHRSFWSDATKIIKVHLIITVLIGILSSIILAQWTMGHDGKLLRDLAPPKELLFLFYLYGTASIINILILVILNLPTLLLIKFLWSHIERLIWRGFKTPTATVFALRTIPFILLLGILWFYFALSASLGPKNNQFSLFASKITPELMAWLEQKPSEFSSVKDLGQKTIYLFYPQNRSKFEQIHDQFPNQSYLINPFPGFPNTLHQILLRRDLNSQQFWNIYPTDDFIKDNHKQNDAVISWWKYFANFRFWMSLEFWQTQIFLYPWIKQKPFNILLGYDLNHLHFHPSMEQLKNKTHHHQESTLYIDLGVPQDSWSPLSAHGLGFSESETKWFIKQLIDQYDDLNLLFIPYDQKSFSVGKISWGHWRDQTPQPNQPLPVQHLLPYELPQLLSENKTLVQCLSYTFEEDSFHQNSNTNLWKNFWESMNIQNNLIKLSSKKLTSIIAQVHSYGLCRTPEFTHIFSLGRSFESFAHRTLLKPTENPQTIGYLRNTSFTSADDMVSLDKYKEIISSIKLKMAQSNE